MLLYSNAVCDPPLGQCTVVSPDEEQVQFTLLVESSRSFAEQPWEAILWHDGDDTHNWTESAFHVESHHLPASTISTLSQQRVYRRFLRTSLRRPIQRDHVRFTFKYRVGINGNWTWANEILHTSDGELLFQQAETPHTLGSFLEGSDPALNVQSVRSESPGVLLWSLSAPVRGAQGRGSGYSKISLGVPLKCSRWLALARRGASWLEPSHGTHPFAPENDTLLCSFLRHDGVHLIVLAISGINDQLVFFKGDSNGNLIAHVRNDRDGGGDAFFLAAAGKTFDSAIAATIYQARHVIAGDGRVDRQRATEIEHLLSKEVKTEWLENWHDGLTYCTWNSLGQDLTEEKVLKGLASLKEHNIHVTNVIIDDNHQSLEDFGGHGDQMGKGWSDFEADPKAFPGGYKHLSTVIRETYPNIQHISVWHAILGYWGALAPNGNIARTYKTRLVNRADGRKVTVIDPEDVDRLYDNYYKFLLSQGIDGVKTDVQSALDDIVDAPDRRDLITAVMDGWIIAALRYFSIKVISCMSQFPQAIFHAQLPTNKPRFMIRNSDDFFPEIPDSHAWHIFSNAHNSLLNNHLNVLPDWDMFQTDHEFGPYHAAARCISGGPVYITDFPGHHNPGLVAQMTAQDVRGKSIVLRPSTLGKALNIYTSYHENRLLQVGSFHGAKGGTSILAFFNVSSQALLELLHLNTFLGIETGTEYVVRAYRTEAISGAMSLSSPLPLLPVEVDVRNYEIFSAHPLQSFNFGATSLSATKVAVLGLLGQMTGAAAVLSTTLKIDEHRRLSINASLKALGVLGIYLSNLSELTVEENFLVLIKKNAVAKEFVIIDRSHGVLEIDVLGAWKNLELDPGFNNEIEMDIIVQ